MNTFYLDLDQIDSLTGSGNLPPASVLTIGNFDGVHLGHQAMLKQLQKEANTHGLATMVMIFEPQPREFFAKVKGDLSLAPARLTSKNEKLMLLEQFGIENVIIAKFNESFRSLTALEFADLLSQRLNVTALVLGDDFKFGNDRSGDSEFLRQYGLPITNLQTITDNSVTNEQNDNGIAVTDDRISSTRIRELLNIGDLKTANHLLNRSYSIIGKVVGGDEIGRTIDFPTANIELNRIKPALHGIYGVDVVVLDEAYNPIPDAFNELAESSRNLGVKGLRPHSLFGTANIGTRPSVDKPHDWRLEVFFPQFSGNLYGKILDVRFVHFLHAELKYEDLNALKAGIKQDVVDLLQWRNNQPDSE